jgi:hypothetical protein
MVVPNVDVVDRDVVGVNAQRAGLVVANRGRRPHRRRQRDLIGRIRARLGRISQKLINKALSFIIRNTNLLANTYSDWTVALNEHLACVSPRIEKDSLSARIVWKCRDGRCKC